LPGGICTHWKAPPFHGARQNRTHALQQIREDLTAETIANVSKRASRLYEQECGAVAAAAALEIYVKRWLRWAEERDEAGCRSHGKR